MLIEEDLLNRCYIERIMSGGNAQYSKYIHAGYYNTFTWWKAGDGTCELFNQQLRVYPYHEGYTSRRYYNDLINYYKYPYWNCAGTDSLVVY